MNRHIKPISAAWMLTGISLLIALAAYPCLPEQIPIQYSGKTAVRLAARLVIFAYPVICAAIIAFLRPVLGTWLARHFHASDAMDLAAAYLCFVVLSFELFSILFAVGIKASIAVVLLLDLAVFFVLVLVYYRTRFHTS